MSLFLHEQARHQPHGFPLHPDAVHQWLEADGCWERDCLKLGCPLTPQASPAKLASVAILGFFNIATCLPGTRQRVPNSLHSHSPQADSRLCSLARGFSLGRANLRHHSPNSQHFPVLMGAESGRTHMESPPLHWLSPPRSGPGAFP